MSKLGIPEKPGKATGNRWSNKTLLNPLDKGGRKLEEISLSGAYPIPELTGSKIFPNKTKKNKRNENVYTHCPQTPARRNKFPLNMGMGAEKKLGKKEKSVCRHTEVAEK